MYDEKVVSRTITYFEEALPGQNKYVVLTNKDKKNRRTKIDIPNILYTNYGTLEFWKFVGNSQFYKNVILHYMGVQSARFVKEVANTDNFVWIVWGGDLYNMLLEPYGYKLYAYPESCENWFLNLFHPLNRIRKKMIARKRVELIKKIPSIVIGKYEYKLLHEYFPDISPVIRDFFYYPVNDMVDQRLLKSRSSSNNIFVGNSSQPTNNHRAIFEAISKYDIGKKKVITPLSYGSIYGKNFAIKWGKSLLKENFCPIVEYLPLEKYNELMLSASVFIYGQYRQEAFGNIVIALYIGGIVVLDPRNPLLAELKEKGFIVFSIEELGLVLDYKMPEDYIEKNRKLINTYYCKDRLLSVIKKSFS